MSLENWKKYGLLSGGAVLSLSLLAKGLFVSEAEDVVLPPVETVASSAAVVEAVEGAGPFSVVVDEAMTTAEVEAFFNDFFARVLEVQQLEDIALAEPREDMDEILPHSPVVETEREEMVRLAHERFAQEKPVDKEELIKKSVEAYWSFHERFSELSSRRGALLSEGDGGVCVYDYEARGDKEYCLYEGTGVLVKKWYAVSRGEGIKFMAYADQRMPDGRKVLLRYSDANRFDDNGFITSQVGALSRVSVVEPSGECKETSYGFVDGRHVETHSRPC